MVKKVLIDPGHGGSDPGAVGNGLLEKVLTLDIANRTKRYLELHFDGVAVYMTRTSDVTLSLDARTDKANELRVDYLASIHINAGGGEGYEDYRYKGMEGATKEAQLIIHGAIMAEIKGYGVKDRGAKDANFHMLRESLMRAILTENLFIDDPEDAKLLKNPAFLEAVARGHAKGIAKVLGLKAKPAPAPKPTPAPAPSGSNLNDTHRVIVDGKQAGAYADDVNVLNEVAKHLKTAKKIVIEEV